MESRSERPPVSSARSVRASKTSLRPPTSNHSDVRDSSVPMERHSRLEDVISSLNHGTCRDPLGAAEFLRSQCRESAEAREAVVTAGGLRVIAALVHNVNAVVMENSVTAFHNLSLSDNLHRLLVKSDVLTALTYALEKGNAASKANAAATVFNLCKTAGLREVVAANLGLYGPLVTMLEEEDLRGRKDSAHAMCYLSLDSQGRRELVKAGVVPVLIELSGREDMAEKVTAVLGNLSKCSDSRVALIDGKAVDALADVVQCGDSSRAREDATAALFRLASHNSHTLKMVGDTGILPDLVGISGSEKTSEKGRSNAKALVDLLRTRGLEEGNKSPKLTLVDREESFQSLTRSFGFR